MEAIRDKLGEAAPGGFFDGQSFLPPPVIEPEPPQPTDRELIAALQAEIIVVKSKIEQLESREVKPVAPTLG